MIDMDIPHTTEQVWECVDSHGHYFTTNSLTAIGQHVIAFWLLDTKQNNDTKGETDYEYAQGSAE